jgi:hypothetical protein
VLAVTGVDSAEVMAVEAMVGEVMAGVPVQPAKNIAEATQTKRLRGSIRSAMRARKLVDPIVRIPGRASSVG